MWIVDLKQRENIGWEATIVLCKFHLLVLCWVAAVQGNKGLKNGTSSPEGMGVRLEAETVGKVIQNIGDAMWC